MNYFVCRLSEVCPVFRILVLCLQQCDVRPNVHISDVMLRALLRLSYRLVKFPKVTGSLFCPLCYIYGTKWSWVLQKALLPLVASLCAPGVMLPVTLRPGTGGVIGCSNYLNILKRGVDQTLPAWVRNNKEK